jgi:hypothetical protein
MVSILGLTMVICSEPTVNEDCTGNGNYKIKTLLFMSMKLPSNIKL